MARGHSRSPGPRGEDRLVSYGSCVRSILSMSPLTRSFFTLETSSAELDVGVFCQESPARSARHAPIFGLQSACGLPLLASLPPPWTHRRYPYPIRAARGALLLMRLVRALMRHTLAFSRLPSHPSRSRRPGGWFSRSNSPIVVGCGHVFENVVLVGSRIERSIGRALSGKTGLKMSYRQWRLARTWWCRLLARVSYQRIGKTNCV